LAPIRFLPTLFDEQENTVANTTELNPQPVDPRTIGPPWPQQGTKMRDGAVDPKSNDYKGPSNAGQAGDTGNPHGKTVISPGI
jgi:hypothetical protein